jgi:hypothetical protein
VSTICAGIDPGKSGCIVITNGRAIAHCMEMPMIRTFDGLDLVDGEAVLSILQGFQPLLITIERAQAGPRDGKGRAFNYGRYFSAVEQAAHIYAVRETRDREQLDLAKPPPLVRYVTPVKWKNWCGLRKATKEQSLQVARSMFGAQHFTLVKHHNRAEAALISHYGELHFS